MKNIFDYNCFRKPNIMQTNIIDCMALRSAKIRIQVVIRRTSRVYFASFSTQASWSGQNNVHFCPSIILHCRPPLHQINPHHMLYSNPRHMLYSNPCHMLYSNPRNMLYSNPCHMLYSIPRYTLYSNPRHILYSNPRHMLHSNPRHILYLNPASTVKPRKDT